MSAATHSYVGRRPGCGCLVAACVDDGDRGRIATAIADFARGGYIVERVTVEVVRAELHSCQHAEVDSQPALLEENQC